MKYKITLLAIFISIGLSSIGQVNIDSLWNVWNDTNQPDTTRLKAIHDIAKEGYSYSQPDSAFYFAQMGYDFAKSKGLKKQMADALSLQGMCSYYKGNLTIASDYHKRSLAIQEEIGNMKGISVSLHNIGINYHVEGDYVNALNYYRRSLTINEKIGNKNGIAMTLGNIGMIYRDQGDIANALDCYTRSLAINEKIMNKRGIAFALSGIGNIYNDHGDYSTAIDYYNRSIAFSEEIDDKRRIAFSLVNIGMVYYKQGDSARALDYYTRSLTLFEEIETKQGIAQTLKRMGDVHYEQGDYASAIAYNSRSLSIAQEIGLAEETRDAAQALYELYKATNRQKPALEMYELYITTRDSINSEENQKEVIRQKYKYEYDKQAIADSVAYIQVQKVQQAKLEKSKTQQLALIIGVILLLVFLAYMYNRFRVTRKQKLIISEQNKELATATELAETANSELQTKSEELEKFNTVMLDREMRIIELKKEVNNLAKTNDTGTPYPEIGDK